jgi:hypothetical protein
MSAEHIRSRRSLVCLCYIQLSFLQRADFQYTHNTQLANSRARHRLPLLSTQKDLVDVKAPFNNTLHVIVIVSQL